MELYYTSAVKREPTTWNFTVEWHTQSLSSEAKRTLQRLSPLRTYSSSYLHLEIITFSLNFISEQYSSSSSVPGKRPFTGKHPLAGDSFNYMNGEHMPTPR